MTASTHERENETLVERTDRTEKTSLRERFGNIVVTIVLIVVVFCAFGYSWFSENSQKTAAQSEVETLKQKLAETEKADENFRRSTALTLVRTRDKIQTMINNINAANDIQKAYDEAEATLKSELAALDKEVEDLKGTVKTIQTETVPNMKATMSGHGSRITELESKNDKADKWQEETDRRLDRNRVKK